MTEIEVTCAIILKDKKILIVQRSEKMNMALKWEFPGGKVNKNENYEDCIIREIKEELNITIKLITRLNESIFDYGNCVIKLIPFVCEYNKGEVTLEEHKAVLWVEPYELKNFDWCEADISIVESLLRYLN